MQHLADTMWRSQECLLYPGYSAGRQCHRAQAFLMCLKGQIIPSWVRPRRCQAAPVPVPMPIQILTPVTACPDTGWLPWGPQTNKKPTDYGGLVYVNSTCIQLGTMQRPFDHNWPFIHSQQGFKTVCKHFLLTTKAIWSNPRSYLRI